jgi:hypothetical protein
MKQRLRILMVSAMLGVAGIVHANNISVNNIALEQSGVGYTHVACDVAWDRSWRASWTETNVTPNVAVSNWDAAWVFVKFRVATNNAPWLHATLSTNNSDHVVPSQALFNVGTSSNAVSANLGVGGFLYRKDEGSGNWSNRIKLCWNYAQDGVTNTSQVVISVHAIEMVYVPQGPFYVGDGTTANVQGHFCSNTTGTVPFQITNDNYTITLGGGGAGSLGNNNELNMTAPGDDFDNITSTNLPGAFPKGYNAFYCMKYEISEGQWVSFFNMLTDSQKTTRDITSNVNGGKNRDDVTNRNTVAWITGDATTAAPDRACSYLNWSDGAAYADWAGLRPMTELEFEKACRGPLTSVTDEYAWGAATVIADSGDGTINLTVPEDGRETNKTSVALGAAIYGDNNIYTNGVSSGKGPVRCGLFATATSTRITSGATYWGIMEMSGSLLERPVTVGNTTGRAFTGAVGDGKLDATGDANADYWPPATGLTSILALGAGHRGGSWSDVAKSLHTSSRVSAAWRYYSRAKNYGFRAVRQAPSGGQ